jgi:N utilization substance protein A
VAIGKRGQNVRLASKLTGWNIDVRSETSYSEAMRTGYDSLMGLPGVGANTADALYEHGLYSIEELANASVEELTQIKGISDKKAQALLESAHQILTRLDEDGQEKDEDTAEPVIAQESSEETEKDTDDSSDRDDAGETVEP